MSMRPYGGFTFTFENEAQAAQAFSIIEKEIGKTMELWSEAVKQNGSTIAVDMKTDLGDGYNEETDQMAYRDGTELLLDVCKKIIKKDPETAFRLEAKIIDDEAFYWVDEKAEMGKGGFSYQRNTQINYPDFDALEEYDADVDLDEVDPDDYSMLEAMLTVTGVYVDGKWSFKKKQKCNLE